MPPSSNPAAGQVARVIHMALAITPLIFLAVAWFVIRTRPMPPAGNPVIHFALVGCGLLGMVAGALLALRIESRRSGQGEGEYWQAVLPRAIVVWALFEAGALLTGVAGLLSGVLLYPLLGVVAFLGLMIGFTPGRFAGG